MPLTLDEKQKVKYHLGYPLLGMSAALAGGMPLSKESSFVVDSNLEKVPEIAIPFVRSHIATLDGILSRMIGGQRNLAADQLEDLRLRKDFLPSLRTEYKYWQSRLGQVLNCPINPDFSMIGDVDGGPSNVRMG